VVDITLFFNKFWSLADDIITSDDSGKSKLFAKINNVIGGSNFAQYLYLYFDTDYKYLSRSDGFTITSDDVIFHNFGPV